MNVGNLLGNHFFDNQRKKNEKGISKTLQKLSTGYSVNSAADDAAGLAVSEKLRGIKTGLIQGTDNVSDGISYVKTVEGASQEIHTILDRLKTLAVQSANGTYVDEIDRNAIDNEYQQLIEEINQITHKSDFNGVRLFDDHMACYGTNEGSKLNDTQSIEINETNDTLIIGYSMDNSTPSQCIVKIPHGIYRPTEKLADVIDTELFSSAPNIIINMNDNGVFTLQAEPGQVNTITGSARSLFFDSFIGSDQGFLIGVTRFMSETARLPIVTGKNDTMTFRLGEDNEYTVVIPPSQNPNGYTRTELIDCMNGLFQGSGIPVEATAMKNDEGYDVIALGGDTYITGLAGNFIKLETRNEAIYTSPLYDIAKYASVENTPAVLTGAKTLGSSIDIIRGRNDYFCLNIYDKESDSIKNIKVNLLDDTDKVTYTQAGLSERISSQLESSGIGAQVKIESGKLVITSDTLGKKSSIVLDTSDIPSKHMVYDLFDSGNLSKVTPSPSSSSYSPATVTSGKDLSDVTELTGSNNSITIQVTKTDGSTSSLTLTADAGSYSREGLAGALNSALEKAAAAAGMPEMSEKTGFYISSGKLILAASSNPKFGGDIQRVDIDSSSSAFPLLFGGNNYANSSVAASGTSKPLYGSPSVNTVAGTTKPAVTYVKTTSFTQGGKETYLYTSSVSPKTTAGTTTVTPPPQGEVSDPITATTPAKLELTDVLTQFTKGIGGTNASELSLKMGINTSSGRHQIDINIPAGKTASQAVDIIKNAVSEYADVTHSGNTLQFTTKDSGSSISFDNISGTLLNRVTGTNNKASQSGSTLVRDTALAKDMVYTPPKLKLSNVNTLVPLEIESGKNDVFSLDIGGANYNITLPDNASYTSAAQLSSELEKLFNEKYTDFPMTFSSDSSSITLMGKPGETLSASVASDSTCHIGEKRTVNSDGELDGDYIKTPGMLTSPGFGSHFPLTVISGVNDEVDITYTVADENGNATSQNVTVTLSPGTYSGTSGMDSIISQINAADSNLIASKSGSSLVISTSQKGSGCAVTSLGGSSNFNSYKNVNDSSVGSSEIDYDSKTYSTPATLKNPAFKTLTDTGLIVDDSNDRVSVNVTGKDGSVQNVAFTLPHREYSGSSGLSDLVQDLQNGFSAAGSDLIVTYNSTDGLKLTTADSGSKTKITIATDNTSYCFKKASAAALPTSKEMTEKRVSLTGRVSLTDPVVINSYNNTMSFTYSENGVNAQIELSIDGGTQGGDGVSYTPQQLADAINESLGASPIKDSLKVTVSGGKLTLSGAKVSNTMKISDFGGELFNTVFQDASYSTVKRHSEKAGTTDSDPIMYIVGRNNMEPFTDYEKKSGKNVAIFPDINDELTFDLTYDGIKTSVTIKIPSGDYYPSELAQAVETAGREAIKDIRDPNGNPFPDNFFNASIGLPQSSDSQTNSAISSADKLVLWCSLPENDNVDSASVIIDGVRGSSAYRIFYDASSSPSPSYVVGAQNISNGAVFTDNNNTMSFTVNDQPYSVTIPAGTYSQTELLDELNNCLRASDANIRVRDHEGYIMYYSVENGDFDIDNFEGPAADILFYNKQGRENDDMIGIHFGRRTNSYIFYEKTRVDERLLRINTTGVTSADRALKAVERLDYAINYLSMYRSLSGANENRSEHTLNRVNVYIENLAAADSQLRDTNAAQEMADFTKQQIIMQAQNAVATKLNEQAASILNLLNTKA